MDIKELEAKLREKIRPEELWDVQKILSRLCEEVGEVHQAFRRKGPLEQREELGDVIFTSLALALKLGYDIERLIDEAVDKHIRFWH